MKNKLPKEILLELVRNGVYQKVPKSSGSYKNAYNGGVYLGAPGKDLYWFLLDADDNDMELFAQELCKQFPRKPPGNHVAYAACIRYIYGQFEKQGTLRSDSDFKRMKKEGIDWEKPRIFIDKMFRIFKENNHYYGLTILCEMEAHRLGDEAILNNDGSKLDEMESMYCNSWNNAKKCKSYKHLFSPYYWSARYFAKYGDKKRALKYSILTLRNAEKYCPGSKKSYVDKVLFCVKYIKKNDKENWEKIYNKYKKSARNKCVIKTFSKIKG